MPDVASAWHHQASWPASAPTGPGTARAPAHSAHQVTTHGVAHAATHEVAQAATYEVAQAATHEVAQAATYEVAQAANSGARKAHVEAPPPGSYVTLTHLSNSRPEATGNAADAPYPDVTTPPIPHPTAQIGGLFDGLLLVDPGLLTPGWWRPEPDLDPGEDTRRTCAGVPRLSAR
ncbi:SAM-dependent methyltransferase [Actinoplanes sp. NPDC004185]